LSIDPPILKSEPEKKTRDFKPGLSVDRLVLFAGIFIILLGWVDILVSWFPLGFGSPEWEFGVVSATVDGLPLSTLGLVMTLLGAAASESRRGLQLALVWATWVFVVLVVCGVLYALTVPVALGVLGPEGLQAPLGRAVVKTSTLLLAYLGFYGWMGLQAIRHLWGRS
jgi:hypothetical protein